MQGTGVKGCEPIDSVHAFNGADRLSGKMIKQAIMIKCPGCLDKEDLA